MKKKGFTLIELLAVILILGIIALIAIPAVTNVIEDSKRHAAEVTAMSYIKAINDQNALYKLQPDKFTPITSGDVEDLEVNLKGDGPSTGTVTITNGKVSEAELCANGYTVTYNGVSTTVESKCGATASLLSYVKKVKTTGIYQTTINNVTYDLNVIVLDGDQTITSNTTYGTLDDCASGTGANQMAKRMVIVKVNGNYTINNNVTVGPTYNETYGGPKGFMLYVKGTLTNNGTIDNSHGAYAEGQDVYLYSNSNGSYEFVPAQGGLGGEKKSGTNSTANHTMVYAGNSGQASSVARGTGGGASGGVYVNYDHTETGISGAGARGTSYSGGSGGGMVASVWGSNVSAQDGAPNGGAGGNAKGSWNNYVAVGGTGNPGGNGSVGTGGSNSANNSGTNGKKGTGGLLIIYADSIVNNNKISANGTESFGVTLANVSTKIYGGPSGGGSVNIFYNTSYTSTGTVESNGGANENGVTGGAGSVSIGSLRTGSYVANN